MRACLPVLSAVHRHPAVARGQDVLQRAHVQLRIPRHHEHLHATSEEPWGHRGSCCAPIVLCTVTSMQRVVQSARFCSPRGRWATSC